MGGLERAMAEPKGWNDLIWIGSEPMTRSGDLTGWARRCATQVTLTTASGRSEDTSAAGLHLCMYRDIARDVPFRAYGCQGGR